MKQLNILTIRLEKDYFGFTIFEIEPELRALFGISFEIDELYIDIFFINIAISFIKDSPFKKFRIR